MVNSLTNQEIVKAFFLQGHRDNIIVLVGDWRF